MVFTILMSRAIFALLAANAFPTGKPWKFGHSITSTNQRPRRKPKLPGVWISALLLVATGYGMKEEAPLLS
jgi:hypothetical protein